VNTRIRQSLMSLLALALITTAVSCSSSNDEPSAAVDGNVVVRIPDPGNYGGLAGGKRDGSLEAALAAVGASVEWTGTAGAFAPAALSLNNDQLDVASGSITSAIAALSQSPSFALFAASAPDQSGEGILVKGDSPIKDVRDLTGKKVAVSRGGSSEYLFLKALEKNGVDPNSVERVYLPPDQTAPLLNSGQVDAWATWASFSIPQRASASARFIATGGEVGSKNYAVWAVRDGFVKEHPAVVKALFEYIRDSDVSANKDPENFVNVFRTSGPDAVSGQERTLLIDYLRSVPPTEPIGPTELTDFTDVAEFFADQKVTPDVLDVGPHVIDVTTLETK
jgi:sulfonate transport system substrate-binding protein